MDHPSTTFPASDLPDIPEPKGREGIRVRVADFLANAPETIRTVLRDYPYWVAVGIPLAILMVYVYVLTWPSWFDFDSTLCFQPFVPFAVAYAIWRDRLHVQMGYEEFTQAFVEGSARKRGQLFVPGIGCLLILAGAVSTQTTLAVVGLVFILAGGVYYLYGPQILRVVGQPLFYLIFMIPPPLMLITVLTQKLQIASTIVAAQILQVFLHNVHTSGVVILLPNFALEVGATCSGISIIFPVFVLTAFLALIKRMHLSWTGIVLILSIIVAVTLNVIRIVVMGLIGGSSPDLANRLHDANSLFFAALSFYLTYLLIGLIMRPARRKPTEFEKDLALSAQMQDEDEEEFVFPHDDDEDEDDE